MQKNRNNKKLKASKTIKEIYDGESIVLEITCGTDGTEEGDYTCVATNSIGKASHGARVSIEGADM
jgi:DNA-directed RNA polymerase III subunit RPC5